MPRLLQPGAAGGVGAVFVSHGHPGHCADLNPLLRARALGDDPVPPMPVYAPAGAPDAVLALVRPQTLAGAYEVGVVTAGAGLDIGPFRCHCLGRASVTGLGAPGHEESPMWGSR